MTQIILDEITLSKLTLVPSTTEVCDANGTVVGTFVPVVQVRIAIGDPPRSPYSDEELLQIMKEPARPLSEIWKSLGRS